MRERYVGRHISEKTLTRREFLKAAGRLGAFVAATSAVAGGTGALLLDRYLNQLGLDEIDPDLESKFPFSPEMMNELNNPFYIEDPQTGQKFNAILVNAELLKQGETPIITFQGYNATIGSLSGKLGLGILADKTNLPVLAIDYADVGGSDPLTEAQIASFKKGEGFVELARATARALKEFGIKKAVFAGNSMAASFIAVLLSQLPEDFEVKKAILGELVGVREFDKGQLSINFARENQFLIGELSHPTLSHPNEKLILQASFQDTALGRIAGMGHFTYTLLDNDPRFYYSWELTKKFVPSALATALRRNKNLIAVLANGIKSTVSPNQDIHGMFVDLNQEFLGRVEEYSIPGKTHAVFVNPIVWADFVSEHLS